MNDKVKLQLACGIIEKSVQRKSEEIDKITGELKLL